MNPLNPSKTPYPFPEWMDNTFISTFRTCPRKAFYQGVMRIVPQTQSNTNLIAGGAFAKGLEVTRKTFYDEGKSLALSLKTGSLALIIAYGDHEPIGRSSLKNVWRTLLALHHYFEAFPIDKALIPKKLLNGKHSIEYSFAVPLDFKNPETNEPVVYTGRYDLLAESEKGTTYIVDEKTSTMLGESWANQWKMSNQMSGYVWASQKCGLKVSWAWIRGLAFLSKGYSTADVPTYRPPWRIKAFEDNLYLTLNNIKNAWETNQWEQNLGKACSDFGACPYLQLCEAEHPEEWIPINFIKNTWNPLH